MLPLYITQALLGAGYPDLSQDFVVNLAWVVKHNGPVAQANRDGIFIRKKLDGEYDPWALDVSLQLHRKCVIDAHELHILFVEDHLVNLLEVKDLLNVIVMGRLVHNIGLSVEHLDVTRWLTLIDVKSSNWMVGPWVLFAL